LTGWNWLDPLVSVLIALIILSGSARVLREAIHILAEGAPSGMNASRIAGSMVKVEGVSEVHDLHVWTVSPGYVALSAHVVLTDQSLSQSQRVMDGIKQVLSKEFNIEHTTIQLECDNCGQGMVMCLNDE
jgi:cobalt-zinc-cadmium efflux system protein